MRVLLLVDFANLYSSCQSDNSRNAGNRLITVIERLRRYLMTHTTTCLRDAVIAHAEIAVLDDQKWRPRWEPLEKALCAAGFCIARIRHAPLGSGEKRQQVSAGDDDHLIHVARTRWSEFDAVVLLSNDGDYAETMHRLREEARIPAIVGSYETAKARLSGNLRHAASEVLPLRDITDEDDQPAPLPEPLPVPELNGKAIEMWRDGEIVLNFPLDRDRIEIGRRSVRLGHFPDVDLTDYDPERGISRLSIYLCRDVNGEWKVGMHPECRSAVWLNGADLAPGVVVDFTTGSEMVLAGRIGITFR